MARGKDERHNPRRVISKWHVLHAGETASVHDDVMDAYSSAREMHELYGDDDSNLIQIEHRTEDDDYGTEETHG